MKGLVLEGGGVKGAYHVGVLQELFKAGYVFDAVAGTSIGALNAVMIVQGKFDQLVELWKNIEASDILDVDGEMLEKLESLSPAKWFDRGLWMSLGKKLFSLDDFYNNNTEKMHNFVKEHIDEQAVRDSAMDFGIVTVEYPSFEPHELMKKDIPQGTMEDYIIASATFPVYKFVHIDGKKFVDGGLYDNMPINLLARNGYKDIVAIRTSSKPPKRKLEIKDTKVTYIVPTEDLGMAMMFTEDCIERNLKLGHWDAQKFLKGYRGQKYYVKAERGSLERLLTSIPLEFYINALQWLDLLPYESVEENIQLLTSVIKNELKLSTDDTEDCFISLIEPFAALFNVEKYHVYDACELLQATVSAGKHYRTNRAIFFEESDAVKSKKLREIFYCFLRRG